MRRPHLPRHQGVASTLRWTHYDLTLSGASNLALAGREGMRAQHYVSKANSQGRRVTLLLTLAPATAVYRLPHALSAPIKAQARRQRRVASLRDRFAFGGA